MRSKSITFLSPFDQWRSRLGDYWTLCKPRLLSMVVLSAMMGYYLPGVTSDPTKIFHLVLGTLLIGGGLKRLIYCASLLSRPSSYKSALVRKYNCGLAPLSRARLPCSTSAWRRTDHASVSRCNYASKSKFSLPTSQPASSMQTLAQVCGASRRQSATAM